MTYLLILLAVSLVVSAIGWKFFIYFFSLGYGFSISALAITMFIIFYPVVTVPAALLCAVLLVFGFRLGGYLFIRERKAAAYRKILHGPETEQKKPLGVVLMVWVFCALLYVGQVSPVAFRLGNMAEGHPVHETWAWIGAVIMILGVMLEAGADAQKSAAKKVNPKRFVDNGLYKLVRCPNYLGELVIWTGCLLSGIGAGLSVWQWIIALAGYVGIIYVMFSGARRLELRQEKVYGNNPEFQEYVRKTPILLPFIPLYSVAKYEWLRA